MIRKHIYFIASAFFAIIMMSQISCTIIGFVIGSARDRQQPKKEKTIQSQEIAELNEGTLVTIHRTNKEPITGFFRGSTNVASSGDSTFIAILIDKKGRQSEQYRIPIGQIDHIYIPPRKSTGKIIGTAIGVAIDVTLGIIFFSDFSY